MSKENKQICVITFHSTYYALKAEDIFKKSGVKVKLIPVPRSLSSNCGICLEFSCREKEKILNLVKIHKIKTEKIIIDGSPILNIVWSVNGQ